MPIYEYVCMTCESHFEELVRNGEEPPCPDCGGEKVAKQLSTFARSGSPQPSLAPQAPVRRGGCCGGGCGC